MWIRLRISGIVSALALWSLASCGASQQRPAVVQELPQRSYAAPAAIGAPDVVGIPRPGAQLSPTAGIKGAGHYSKKGQLLFVPQWYPPQLDVYSMAKKSFKSVATITDSINTPQQITTDSNGTLYVSSALGDYVTEFPNGAIVPNKEISDGLTEPFGVVVDSSGTLYVSNQSPPSIVEYASGSSYPSLTITSGMFGVLLGMALDKSGNLYVADDVKNQVFEVPKGSATPQSLFLEMPGCGGASDPYYPTSVGFDKSGRLYVSCTGGNMILVYKLPKVTPIKEITAGTEPYIFSFDQKGNLFVPNYGGGNVEELAAPKYRTVLNEIDVTEPIAAYVRPKL